MRTSRAQSRSSSRVKQPPAASPSPSGQKTMKLPMIAMQNTPTAEDSPGTILARTMSSGVGVCSMQGRRPYQEDEYALHPYLTHGNAGTPETHLFGLFDGHAGGRCSQHVASNLANVLLEDEAYSTNLPQAIKRAFHSCNEQFLKVADKLKLHDGSTGLVAILRDNKLLVANAGDCRAIVVSSGRTIQMSNDHKPTNPDEQKRINSLGGSVVYCMGVARVNRILAVSRAFGNRTLRTVIRPDAELMQRDIADSDEFLVMASDGLWDVLKNKDVCDVCYSPYLNRKPQAIAEELVQTALARGSMDNVTCIVVALGEFRGQAHPRSGAGVSGPSGGGMATHSPDPRDRWPSDLLLDHRTALSDRFSTEGIAAMAAHNNNATAEEDAADLSGQTYPPCLVGGSRKMPRLLQEGNRQHSLGSHDLADYFEAAPGGGGGGGGGRAASPGPLSASTATAGYRAVTAGHGKHGHTASPSGGTGTGASGTAASSSTPAPSSSSSASASSSSSPAYSLIHPGRDRSPSHLRPSPSSGTASGYPGHPYHLLPYASTKDLAALGSLDGDDGTVVDFGPEQQQQSQPSSSSSLSAAAAGLPPALGLGSAASSPALEAAPALLSSASLLAASHGAAGSSPSTGSNLPRVMSSSSGRNSGLLSVSSTSSGSSAASASARSVSDALAAQKGAFPAHIRSLRHHGISSSLGDGLSLSHTAASAHGASSSSAHSSPGSGAASPSPQAQFRVSRPLSLGTSAASHWPEMTAKALEETGYGPAAAALNLSGLAASLPRPSRPIAFAPFNN